MFNKKAIKLKEVNSVKFIKDLVNKSEVMKEQQDILKDCYYIEDVIMVVLNYGVYDQLNFAIMNNSEIVKGKMGDMIFVGNSLTSIEHIGIITRISNDGTLEYVTADCNGETKFCETNIYSNRLKLSCSMISLLKSRSRKCKSYIVCNSRTIIYDSMSAGSNKTFVQKGTILPCKSVSYKDGYATIYFGLFKEATGFVKINDDIIIINTNKRNELDLEAISNKVSKRKYKSVVVKSEAPFFYWLKNQKRNDVYPMVHKDDVVYVSKKFNKENDMIDNYVTCMYNGMLGFIDIKYLNESQLFK